MNSRIPGQKWLLRQEQLKGRNAQVHSVAISAALLQNINNSRLHSVEIHLSTLQFLIIQYSLPQLFEKLL